MLYLKSSSDILLKSDVFAPAKVVLKAGARQLRTDVDVAEFLSFCLDLSWRLSDTDEVGNDPKKKSETIPREAILDFVVTFIEQRVLVKNSTDGALNSALMRSKRLVLLEGVEQQKSRGPTVTPTQLLEEQTRKAEAERAAEEKENISSDSDDGSSDSGDDDSSDDGTKKERQNDKKPETETAETAKERAAGCY